MGVIGVQPMSPSPGNLLDSKRKAADLKEGSYYFLILCVYDYNYG